MKNVLFTLVFLSAIMCAEQQQQDKTLGQKLHTIGVDILETSEHTCKTTIQSTINSIKNACTYYPYTTGTIASILLLIALYNAPQPTPSKIIFYGAE